MPFYQIIPTLSNLVAVTFFPFFTRGLTKLKYILIKSTPITDAGLVLLKGLKQLRVLAIWYNHEVTEEGINKLKNDLPNLLVTLGP